MKDVSPNSPLRSFDDLTRSWFEGAFAAPTPAQQGAWEAVPSGADVLVVAPTGSGKTLAAFLWSLDRLVRRAERPKDGGVHTLYVSPLKALAVDIERNLRTPLLGMQATARRLDTRVPEVKVGVRTGDTPQDERRRFASSPPDILITTPESLFLLLTSAAREALRSVETVIVDEVHSIAGTKRGAHLALSLERLDHLAARRAQRIGLSATVNPIDEAARFLSGTATPRIVNPPSDKEFDLQVVVPVEDMTAPGDSGAPASGAPDPEELDLDPERRRSIWPHVEERLLELIRAHRSTIVFVNSRRLSERIAARLNELASGDELGSKSDAEQIARAHHGSVARDQRLQIEDDLKAGRLPAVVATSSLELGIDMGAVDLVVQVGAPDSVASGLQRVGRAGHQVGAVSRGIFFPTFRADLLATAVVVERMKEAALEETRYPRNPLDVLAQQIVAMVALDEWTVDELDEVVRRASPFAELPRSALESVLDMLSGRYPSDEFAELRPRLNWDRVHGTLKGRSNAQRLAVTSGGTIPDRGLFGVFIAGARGGRVGELDEEMVYESRPGDVFTLGSSSWLIEDITHDRVLVTPAPGRGGKMPFWHGDSPGRPLELGRALGAAVRELGRVEPVERIERLKARGLDERAALNLSDYLDEQRAATDVLPDDRTIVVERFRDELGDWRVCIHSFFGARVHAPWAQAIEARLRESHGIEVQCIYSDDGIVVRLPEAQDAPAGSAVAIEPEEIEDMVVTAVGGSALFASRFRECAGRSLLLPRRDPSGRTPLWQQRRKSAGLLEVASRYPTFPVILETLRECLQDVFDVPALEGLLGQIARREVRLVEVETPYPSPFAGSLQFGYISAFMYEGDAPLAERRAQALSLDRRLLAELMGREELRELIDAAALTDLELELQRLVPERRARDMDSLHDMLRILGDLRLDEIVARVTDPDSAPGWLEELARDRRAVPVRIAGEHRWIAVEDAAVVRDALGAPLPQGLPEVFLEPVPDPVGRLVAGYARTHGPFVAGDVAARLGVGVAVVEDALRRLEAAGRVLEGAFRPGGSGTEWVDAEVLRRLRRRSLAALRHEIEPAPRVALARFTAVWHGLGGHGSYGRDPDALYRAVEQLQGVPIPASALETQVLPARIAHYVPAVLDELSASGEVVWWGSAPIGSNDGWISLATADTAPLLAPPPVEEGLSDEAVAIRDALAARGASFFRDIVTAVKGEDDSASLLALWELVWAGWVTNDTLAPVRALLTGKPAPRRHAARRGRRPKLPTRTGPPAAVGRWSLVPERESDHTRRMHVTAEQLLVRHGIVTRGAVAGEEIRGGFAAVYPVLKAFEESGRCRRGYFVEGLGGAQFALPGAVDRMRSLIESDDPETNVLAATDPANPYGLALPWPERETGQRAGRKPGALVVLAGGELVLYVEKGGRSLLTYTHDREVLQSALDAVALAAKEGVLGKLDVAKVDGADVIGTPLADVLLAAGFTPSSQGLRLRA